MMMILIFQVMTIHNTPPKKVICFPNQAKILTFDRYFPAKAKVQWWETRYFPAKAKVQWWETRYFPAKAKVQWWETCFIWEWLIISWKYHKKKYIFCSGNIFRNPLYFTMKWDLNSSVERTENYLATTVGQFQEINSWVSLE